MRGSNTILALVLLLFLQCTAQEQYISKFRTLFAVFTELVRCKRLPKPQPHWTHPALCVWTRKRLLIWTLVGWWFGAGGLPAANSPVSELKALSRSSLACSRLTFLKCKNSTISELYWTSWNRVLTLLQVLHSPWYPLRYAPHSLEALVCVQEP